MQFRKVTILAVLVLALLVSGAALSADAPTLKPYVLGSSGPGTIKTKLGRVKAALKKQGFEVAGEYTPYKGARVVVVTSDALKKAASRTSFGAYGAVQRVSLTETARGLQVAYTNPLYMAQAYRMKDSLAGTAKKLEKALGRKTTFGSKEGLTKKKLRKYHYMMMMPYFSDPVRLDFYPSQEKALQIVEANLAARKGGAVKVYRVDVPGNSTTVFGIGITNGKGADATVMQVTDKGKLKHTAHLPYEIVVSEGKVYMLHGKFRIALSFPDLTMGTFMKISGAPGGIADSLRLVAGEK